MSYKTILAHWADESAPAHNIGLAARLAGRFDGHLTAIAFGIEPNIAAYGYGAPGVAVLSTEIEAAQDQALTLKRAAEDWIAQDGVRGDVHTAICSIDGLSHTMAAHARYCDLAVMEEPYGSERDEVSIRVLEGALFDGAAPVIVCPGHLPERVGSRIVVAWDRSLEALHAVRGALPFLKAAESVELTMIDPSVGESGEDDPGADMALLLSRHGVSVEVAQVPSTGLSTSDALRKRIMDIGADMLVMGAYSHSRLREALIGGATRDMLEAPPVPLLMAH